MRDRALTPEQKKATLDRIYQAWLQAPQQRLGQLISNSVKVHNQEDGSSLYFVEDSVLASWAEDFVEEYRPSKSV